MDITEQWKPVNDFQGYWVSESGKVWRDEVVWFCGRNNSKRFSPAKELKPFLKKGGVPRLRITFGFKVGQPKFFVHRLVAQHFLNSPPNKKHYVVHHKDGNALNNHYTNLEWCLPNRHWDFHRKEQSERFRKRQLGSGNTMAKLKERQVLEISRQLDEGKKLIEIANSFGIAITTVSAIKEGRTWSHLTKRAEGSVPIKGNFV